MSLTKLFNFKYLMQNMKKSKMALTLFFIIVPIFTSLMIITIQDEVLEFAELSLVNICGMYVIPFIFSVCLFGYVYKKNSVDFMCSMPISRKAIFITNTIGGIALIVLMQLVTFLLTILLGAITEATIFTSMAVDILLFQTVGYIFVFMICNLAMSVSGNLLTQIVVTLLITFLIPFSTFFVTGYTANDDVELYNTYGDMNITFNRMMNYTAPSLMFSGSYEYSSVSMLKMIVLSVIYFAIGLYLFNKRKMETAPESFEKTKTHLLVKGLTLAPFVVFLVTVIDYESFGIIAILLAIITVYYFVYDLITNKKIKFKDNLIYLVMSVLVLFGAYVAVVAIYDEYEAHLNVDSISKLTIESRYDFKATIEDNDLIKSVLNSVSSSRGEDKTWSTIELTTYGGRKYKRNLYINVNDVLAKTNADLSSALLGNNVKVNSDMMSFTKKEKAEFIQAISNAFANCTFEEYESLKDESLKEIYVHSYKDHKLYTSTVPVEIDENVFKLAVKAYNKFAVGYLKNVNVISHYCAIKTYNVDLLNDEVDSKYVNGYNAFLSEFIIDFIVNSENKEITDFKKGAFISGYKFAFYTEDIEWLSKLLSKQNENGELDVEYSDAYYDVITGEVTTEAKTSVPESSYEVID